MSSILPTGMQASETGYGSRARAPARRTRFPSPLRYAGRAACLAAGLTLLLPGAVPAAEPPGPVTVYRCTDSRGQLVALRDSPCRSGEQQETVQMQRPQDPAPRTASTATPGAGSADATSAAPPREVRVVTVQAPAPLYECIDQEGSTYLSETQDGTQRWVPLWTMGYPVVSGPRPLPRASAPPVAPRAARPPVAGPRPPLRGMVVPAGTWVQDECVRLSQDEVCTRLSDRHYEILRIYHAAMPSEREQLDREQRQVDSHLADHCPGY